MSSSNAHTQACVVGQDGDGATIRCALWPLQEALDRLTKALLHEERRCRYVSREVGIGWRLSSIH
jgi:hypothetical protein